MAFAIQVILGLAALYILHQTYSFYKNLQFARSTGLRYTVSPIYQNTTAYRIFQSILAPYLARLPFNLFPWMELGGFNAWWEHKRAPFEGLGDLFLMVSPGQTMVEVGDADVAFEVTQRRNDFPKPLHQYKILDIYGRNVVTTEGAEWRMHRKITGPPFSERINR